jgi:phenylalanyl-tRNA synthetase beta chain
VAGRSRRYNFSTDAGHRFERGVDPALTVEHIERITQLVIDICGTPKRSAAPSTTSSPKCLRPSPSRCAWRARPRSSACRSRRRSAPTLRRLGLSFTEGEGTLTVTPPAYRFDLRSRKT